MSTETATKPLGHPIEGEDREAMVTCPAGLHRYGLYFYGVRNDLCRPCERAKAKAGDREAQKRLGKFEDLRANAKRAQQVAEERARRVSEAGSRGARWEPWERVSAKGFSMGADLPRPTELRAE